jgi:predicted alpha/beta hydrolase family esterase
VGVVLYVERHQTNKTKMHIIFFHGLESGIHGRKADYLRKQARLANKKEGNIKVHVPDLDMSTWKLTKSNSFTRTALRVLGSNPLYLFQPFQLLHETLKSSLTGCTDIVVSMMENIFTTAADETNNDPIVLVASSWGGAVAIWLLISNPDKIPTWRNRIVRIILIAPAFKLAVTRGLGQEEANTLFQTMIDILKTRTSEMDVVVVHGTNDDEVDVKDSQDMYAKAFSERDGTTARLIIVPNGDHRLNEFLLKQNNLWLLVEGKEPAVVVSNNTQLAQL